MNHRELVLSARKKAKFDFLKLPEQIQDEIIEGLDRRTLTLEAASQRLEDEGYFLSHEGVASYYRAVRRERRLREVNDEFTRMIAGFSEMPTEQGLRSLLNLALATAARGLADGKVGIKDIDLAKMIKAMPGEKEESPGDAEDGREAAAKSPSAEDIRKIREQIGL